MDDSIAHSANYRGKVQPLRNHLRDVGELTAAFAETFGGQEEGRIAGRLHDIGKRLSDVQRYLRGERESSIDTHHAPYGAAVAHRRGWPSSFAIAGHHAGLHDGYGLQRLVDDGGSYMMENRLFELVEYFEQCFGIIPSSIAMPKFLQDENPLTLDVYIRMIFSCLVDADYLDTERHYSGQSRSPVRLSQVSGQMLASLIAERKSKPSSGPVNRARHSVFEQCTDKALHPQGFFSLTVPTGGGKTLSGMAFALAHAKKWHLDRIIVVIPYLSIIEQNAEEYRRILDRENTGLIVEHHSAVAIPDEGETGESSQMQLAVENWDAPIIITTSVQFIESLFAASPSKCRKLHNICRSVVVLDEVQTLPAHLLNPLLSVLKELHRNYAVSFLFMTATQPAFRHHAAFLPEGFRPGDVTEIVDDTSQLFQVLKRVDFQVEERLDWEAVAERMAKAHQVLCVVNVRAQAYELWNMLQHLVLEDEDDSIFHLSSSMCAEHRLLTLGHLKDPQEGSIRFRLKHGLPCRVVSTQVVEAGVDLDFPLVFRAMGPLDSIVQTAGRCNREGRQTDARNLPQRGKVIVFRPREHRLPPGLYKIATEKAEHFLSTANIDALGEEPEVFARYFAELFQLTDTDHSRPNEPTIQQDRAELRFRRVASKAKVIRTGGSPLMVPFGRGKALIEELRSRRPVPGESLVDYRYLRRLQRFMVNVTDNSLRELHQYGMIEQLLPGHDIFVVDNRCYDDRLGLVIREMPVEDLIL